MVLAGLAGEALLLDGEGTTRLLHLAVGAGPGLLGLAHGGDPQLLGLLLGRKPELVALALGRGAHVLGLALGERPLLLGVGGDARPHLVQLLELHEPHVVGLLGRLGTDAEGVARRLLADLVGVVVTGGADLRGLLLGEAEHGARAAAEPGVRRVGVLGEVALRRLERALQLAHPLLGLGQRRARPRPVLEHLAQVGVDGRLVVAPAPDGRERRQGALGGRRGRRRLGSAGRRQRAATGRGGGRCRRCRSRCRRRCRGLLDHGRLLDGVDLLGLHRLVGLLARVGLGRGGGVVGLRVRRGRLLLRLRGCGGLVLALCLHHLRRLLVGALAVRLVEDGQALVAHGVEVLPERVDVRPSVSDGVMRFHPGSPRCRGTR